MKPERYQDIWKWITQASRSFPKSPGPQGASRNLFLSTYIFLLQKNREILTHLNLFIPSKGPSTGTDPVPVTLSRSFDLAYTFHRLPPQSQCASWAAHCISHASAWLIQALRSVRGDASWHRKILSDGPKTTPRLPKILLLQFTHTPGAPENEHQNGSVPFGKRTKTNIVFDTLGSANPNTWEYQS